MPHRSDESLFASFQAQRDCQALSILFHRRADELLRLAVFLAPRPSDAEDLVQATFLSAIAHAETFRRGNRVMSWLCGILTNHARMLRRAERRTQVRTSEVPSEDPADAVLRAELRQALRTGIAGLPEPYRSVLTLHLDSGLDSQEISARLARPPATVRKQMERAIDRLRTALPIGLALAFAARLDAARLASHAADTARFVEPVPVPDAAATPAAPVFTAPRGWLLAIGVAIATVAGLAPWSHLHASPAATPPGRSDLPVASAESAAPTASGATTAIDRQPTELPTSDLRVRVLGADGQPRPDFLVLAVPDTGQALPERLLAGLGRQARTDATGVATFPALADGSFDVTFPGAVNKRNVTLPASTECQLELPPETTLVGQVVDDAGRGVDGAEVIVSESSMRGDLGQTIAITTRDGSFRGRVSLATGRVFARHPAYRGATGARLEADRATRLVLVPKARDIEVTVVDDRGRPVADAYVAVVPRSAGTTLLAPQHGRSDEAGRCVFGDPGAVEGTVLASHPDFAPATTDLSPLATAIALLLSAPNALAGVLVDGDGQPVPRQSVRAIFADQRSNEPVAPLLARAVRTGADGSFRFTGLPRGSVQIQVQGPSPTAPGLLPFPWLLAAVDAEVTAAPDQLRLVAKGPPKLTGRLHRPDHTGVAGWNVLAVPKLGSALHRTFRARGAPTDAAGSFTIEGLAADEEYDLAAYPPGTPAKRAASFPWSTTTGRPGGPPCALVVDPSAPPRASLRVVVLGPDGKPCPGSQLELRNVRCQLPQTKSAADDGSCLFAALAPGEYWLAIAARGLGTSTLAIAVPGDGTVLDLGTITLALAAQLTVRATDERGAPATGVRVIARNTLGDKFVADVTGAGGTVALPALPPGDTKVTVVGPGFAPSERILTLAAGPQWLDLALQPAPTVPLAVTFPLADNPFVVNGPLHVRLFRDDGTLLYEDHLGAVSARGRFECALGLPPGRYHFVARSLWNTRASADFLVPTIGDAPPLSLALQR